MPNIQTSTGENLDSTFTIDTVDGVFGLILESWGPKDRNPDYAKAMEQILSTLIGSEVPFINVYVVSRNLTKAYPSIEDRAISINGSSNISLAKQDPHELRITIGREVGDLKENPEVDSKGGNRFKRILIHNPILSEADWLSAASSIGKIEGYGPTADIAQLDRVVANLRGQSLENPSGSIHPKQSSVMTSVFLRDPLVKAWVLNNSNGICEACSQPAPFVREDGSQYLEVHHLLPLSEGGEDTTRNALAVCPNCHRRLHYGADKSTLIKELRQRINRLSHGHGS
jgi:5-methylcytosine-specific restriction protein A